MTPSVVFRTLAVAAVFALTACSGGAGSGGVQSGPAPDAAIPDISGGWTGFVNVEGQGIDGSLQVEQDGPELAVVFQAPSFGLVAEGTGTVSRDGAVVFELLYNLQCPGEARMLGDLSDDGLAMNGQVEAGDCTGNIGGNFRFTR